MVESGGREDMWVTASQGSGETGSADGVTEGGAWVGVGVGGVAWVR